MRLPWSIWLAKQTVPMDCVWSLRCSLRHGCHCQRPSDGPETTTPLPHTATGCFSINAHGWVFYFQRAYNCIECALIKCWYCTADRCDCYGYLMHEAAQSMRCIHPGWIDLAAVDSIAYLVPINTNVLTFSERCECARVWTCVCVRTLIPRGHSLQNRNVVMNEWCNFRHFL